MDMLILIIVGVAGIIVGAVATAIFERINDKK